MKTDWRGKPQLDESLNSPEIVFKSKKGRKPLQPIGNINPSLFGDDSVSLSSEASSMSLQSSADCPDDTFDKLFDNVPKPVDPFDKLFENREKAADPFDRLLTGLSPNPPPTNKVLYCSAFSTPSDAEFSTDTSTQPGLFSSFTKQAEEKTPKLRQKSHRNIRTKKQSARDIDKPRENILSETLEVRVVFEGDTSSKEKNFPSQASSLANLLPPQSPSRGRALTALSVATSTPVLSSRSSDKALSSDPSPSHCMTLSPVHDAIMEDDVFLRRGSNNSSNSPTKAARVSSVASDEFYDATPQKSFVNKSRGNPKFGGPAASLMNHIGWRFSMHTIPIQQNTSSTGTAGVDESALVESVREEEEEEFGEVTVNIACVCGNNQMTASFVIQCDFCLLWFHTDCVQLSKSCIEELEREELDWFCAGCIEEAEKNPDMSKNFTLSTPYKLPESSLPVSSPEVQITSPLSSDPRPSENSALGLSTSFGTRLSLTSDLTQSVCSVVSTTPPSPAFISTYSQLNGSFSKSYSQVSASPSRSRGLFSFPEDPPQQTNDELSSPPASPTTSLLSLTAQLEEHHLAHTDTMQDASLMFVKPNAPPARRPARKAAPVAEEEVVQLKAGKSWRRSLCQAKRTASMASNWSGQRMTSLAENFVVTPLPSVGGLVRGSLSSTEFLDPTPQKKLLPRRSTRHAPIQPYDESVLFATPLKYVSVPPPNPLERKSRSSFCVVPATPRLSKMGGDRMSVLHALSETLLPEEALSETIPAASLPPPTQLTPVQKLLAVCTKKNILGYDAIYPPDVMEGSKKVGEGAFGEVFLLGAAGDDRPVLKVVPIDGDIPVNGETQTTVEDMLSEVIISDSLSKLRMEAPNVTAGFVEVRGCHVFQGAYPPQLLALWDDFNEEHESENDRPDNLPVEQKFIALEFNNGGKDLEKFTFKHASQALQAWKQVAHSLAVAEEELQFEHRDLHWGNVLVKETTDKFVNFTLGGDTYQVETGGVLTTIIDFSLSRLSMDKVTIFNNLSEDPTLFTARGKDQPGGDYQFDIYRKMRELNNNEWESFQPKTNILWLDYMLDKMTTEVYYSAKKTTKPHKSGLGKIRSIRGQLANFGCAADWVRREGDRVD